ncbi:7324_t:CDS:2 [Ambispora gerdemannii]|uniref:7324_t:CDS:1 n=1 Tax=Ambispora gerdemannii TaxID=144530 RepID=A0A9N9CZZ5_9GLOM|nr:7324_t:CDS:2 [Ambispora gerdemannii]
MAADTSQLVADVITEILENLSVRDLLSALLVNREWCQVAVPMYWKAPFSYKYKRSMTALKIYELFLERGSSTLIGTTENSARGTTIQETPMLYDYPLFLKELNYTNLLALKGIDGKVNAILQMLINRGIRLNTFIMDNTGSKSERHYEIWTTPRYASIFSSLIRVEIRTPFPKNHVIKTLAKNCTMLSYLDINLHDNSIDRVKKTLNYLEEFISVQRCPLNLRLVFPNGPGKMLIKTLQSQFESLKRLELVKWNFSECDDWGWLKKCPNLTEFAITSSLQTRVSAILDVKYETYHSKSSNNSRLTTAHWHFDKDGETSSMPNFYFHSGKSSMVQYYDIDDFQYDYHYLEARTRKSRRKN